ncbi:hypothetical protein FOPG_19539 [Fusarium oxysporum f. sp. conglutinans race 2 54008]|uniref:Uncharacterized protein n=1 Tax=Fusarium oxysporum f. sp. conglutinans race 2 54008 TaxID=1089457 RepID=X0GW97_FUSOX|nr:hypothetical protein FOPG_19539 [Fusarium oxysporum f. sp. conglutinans race 2 54008]
MVWELPQNPAVTRRGDNPKHPNAIPTANTIYFSR